MNINKMTKAELIKKVLDMKGLNDLAMHAHENDITRIEAYKEKVEALKDKVEISETINRGYIENHIERLPYNKVHVEELEEKIKALVDQLEIQRHWNRSEEIEERDLIIGRLKNKIVNLVQ